jgi:hypothetical protein
MRSPETEIEVLKEQTRVFDRDLATLTKTLNSMDTKLEEIRQLLTDNYVTKAEFNSYKGSQNIQKMVIGILTSLVTAILTFEITKALR